MVRRKRTATKTDEECIADFLRELARQGNITRACERAEISRTVIYNWRNTDEAFRLAWDEAKELGTDALEDEANRRAFEGVERKKFYKGKPIKDPETKKQYVEREYSDTLLIFMLKGNRPDKYRERVDTRLSDADGKSIPRVAFIKFVDADPRPAADGGTAGDQTPQSPPAG